MALIPFQSLSDPSVTVDVEQGFVNGVEPVSPLLLPPAIPAGTRIFVVARGFGNPGSPSYVDVVGTVAAVIAALGGAPPAPFGTNFNSSIAGFFQTSSAVLVPVPGAQLTIPAAGSYVVLVSGRLSVDNIAEGALCELRKNGVTLSVVMNLPAGFFLAAFTPQASMGSHAFDSMNPGDVLELALAAQPGGGPNLAILEDARITIWRAN